MADYAAERRARELLPRVLSPGERAQYHKNGRIVITGSEGGKYEIRMSGVVGNVMNLQEVKVGRMGRKAPRGSGLCAHPAMVAPTHFRNGRWEYVELPQADAWIGQILAIKADEKGFLKIANKYY